MGGPDKKKRRQSTTFPDLAAIKNTRSESELHDYYMNKNYVAPEKIQLETIFEAGTGNRRGASENGELVRGKNLAKRFIEDYSFWKQNDKDRNKRRKSMIQKQYKGRKKPKLVPSSIEQEEKLIELIQNCPEEEIPDSSRYEQSELGELLEKAYELILLQRRRLYLEENAILASQQQLTTQSHDLPQADLEGNQVNEDNTIPGSSTDSSNTFHLPARSNTPAVDNHPVPENATTLKTNTWNPCDIGTKSADDVFISDGNLETQKSTSISAHETEKCEGNPPDSVSSIDSVFSSTEDGEDFDPTFILKNMKDDAMKEEFLKALEDTDLMFCGNPSPKLKVIEPKKKTERASMRQSVRRSARFLHIEPNLISGGSSLAGSIDIEVDVRVKNKKKTKSKKDVNTETAMNNQTVNNKKKVEKNIPNVTKADTNNLIPQSKTKIVIDKAKKKRCCVAQIDEEMYASNKENATPSPNVSGATHKVKRKPTYRFSYDDDSDLDKYFDKPEKNKNPHENVIEIEMDHFDKPEKIKNTEENDIETSTAFDISTSRLNDSTVGNRSAMDIALPECVRRSLTGEFVPILPRIEQEPENIQSSVEQIVDISSEKSKKQKRKSTTFRNPLQSMPIPDINIEQADTVSPLTYTHDSLLDKDQNNRNKLHPVAVKEQKKDSFGEFSDEEIFLTGTLRLPHKKKKTSTIGNDALNQRIYPSVSSVDSDFA